MKGYRFITDDDTSEFCHRVTEASSSVSKLYGESKMIFDKKKGVIRLDKQLLKKLPKNTKKNKLVFNLNYKMYKKSFYLTK